MSPHFSLKTGPLSSYNKTVYNLTSKFLYINTQYLGRISILGMTPTLPRWKSGTWSIPEVLKWGRFHRLGSLRFIPRRNDVPRVLIHRLSLILCRQGSWLRARSITMTDMSASVHTTEVWTFQVRTIEVREDWTVEVRTSVEVQSHFNSNPHTLANMSVMVIKLVHS